MKSIYYSINPRDFVNFFLLFGTPHHGRDLGLALAGGRKKAVRLQAGSPNPHSLLSNLALRLFYSVGEHGLKAVEVIYHLPVASAVLYLLFPILKAGEIDPWVYIIGA